MIPKIAIHYDLAVRNWSMIHITIGLFNSLSDLFLGYFTSKLAKISFQKEIQTLLKRCQKKRFEQGFNIVVGGTK